VSDGEPLSLLQGKHVIGRVDQVDVDESPAAIQKGKRKKWRSSRLAGYITPADVAVKKAGIGQRKRC